MSTYRTGSLFPELAPPHQVEEQHEALTLFTPATPPAEQPAGALELPLDGDAR